MLLDGEPPGRGRFQGPCRPHRRARELLDDDGDGLPNGRAFLADLGAAAPHSYVVGRHLTPEKTRGWHEHPRLSAEEAALIRSEQEPPARMLEQLSRAPVSRSVRRPLPSCQESEPPERETYTTLQFLAIGTNSR